MKQIIDMGKRLEGLCRNAGMHAAGVVIADQPLDNVVPLYAKAATICSHSLKARSSKRCGLLKMDFLGLRTLTTLERSIRLVQADQGNRRRH